MKWKYLYSAETDCKQELLNRTQLPKLEFKESRSINAFYTHPPQAL